MGAVKVKRLERFSAEILEELVGVYMRGYEGLREYGGEGESYAKRYLHWCWSKARDGFFVAEAGRELAGFIVCDRDWYSKYEGRTVGAIHEFVIDKKFQGRGIGHILMEKGLDYLSHYTDRVELWVGEKNTGAIELYESYGFRRVGQSGIWVRMVKDLHAKPDKLRN